MPRIAIVSEHASPAATMGGADVGGQNIYVHHVATQLARRGWDVDVFTRKDQGELPDVMSWGPRVRIVHLKAGPASYLPKEELLPWMKEFGQGLRHYICHRGRSYDLIHANFFMSGMAALPIAQDTGIPLAVTFHALGRVRRMHQAQADGFSDERFDIEDQLVRAADCLIAECPQDRDDLISLYGADHRRIVMVPCGYDPGELAPVAQTKAQCLLGWDPAQFHVLQLGRMVPRKGIDNVIKALGCLRRDHGIKARLCVVGGASALRGESPCPELQRLCSLAHTEGVAKQVEFVGPRARRELALFYSAADVFVSTPWYEPFGITPVEAMSCLTPVIGSDTGGIRYTVVDGRTGYLVAPKDPVSLAQRLSLLEADPLLARRMGVAGARRAKRLFTWTRVGIDLDQQFRRMSRLAAQPLLAHAAAVGA